MGSSFISREQIIMIVIALVMGTLARFFSLKEDNRQYPSYPNGYMIHLVTGAVAAGLGSVAIPALMTKNFVAVTWLTIAIQQFRDVRKMERESLHDLENTESAFRGSAYIDGIAKTFEVRNYIAFIVALMTSITLHILPNQTILFRGMCGIIVGLVIYYLLIRFTKGKTISDIAIVKEGKVEVRGSELYVDNIFVSNLLGTPNARNLFEQEGIAVVIVPKQQHFRVSLDNFGQRQAALFEATRALGVKRYHFTRKEYEEGKIVITLVPIIHDIGKLIKTIEQIPLLESVKKNHKLMDTHIVDED
ncbi:MAG: YIEGIA domain-containing protein [Bacillaceae bacterium]